ncbi:MAG: helix-turn-helix transcriptional regulator [Clostridia bacterium]|nr:helix-turn-helix transcriptional regulator [Clostridia bacterium]
MDFGLRLKDLRLRRGLTQEELADRCELSKGFISQVERNLASPSIATLTDLLECLGCTLQEFFSDDGNEKTVYTRADMFVKEDDETLKGRITWLVPNAQKNSMEPILVELGPGGTCSEMPPHEGEEFGYVITGTVTLLTGTTRQKVRAGESFCLHPRSAHTLKNETTHVVKFIWVTDPPAF